jgi:hypothetical protein
MFGTKWTIQISGLEDQYYDGWGEGLRHLNGSQIKTGLAHCRFLEWPPTLGEFIKLCESEDAKKSLGPAYQDYKLLPKPKSDKTKVRNEINQMKILLGE